MTQVSNNYSFSADMSGDNISTIVREVATLVRRQMNGLHELQKKVAALKREVNADEQKNKKMKQIIARCNRKMDVAMDTAEENAETCEELWKKVQCLVSRCFQLETASGRKREAMDSLKKKRVEYLEKLGSVREAAEKYHRESPLGEDIAQRQRTVQNLQEEVEKQRSGMANFASDMTALSDEVADLNQRVSEANQRICDLESEMENMKHSFSGRVKNLKTNFLQKEKELEQLWSQLQQTRGQDNQVILPLFKPRMKALAEEWDAVIGQLKQLQLELQTGIMDQKQEQ